MAGLEEVRRVYEMYLGRMEELQRKRKPAEGLFGVGGGPAADPCQEEFPRQLEAVLKALERTEPASPEARQVLEYLYQAPLPYRQADQTVYWMLTAVHGLSLDLISRLTPEDAGGLWEGYRQNYPRWERLPAQKKVLAALNARRKG